MFDSLLESGFQRVLVLDGAACGSTARRVLLCIAPYESAVERPDPGVALIHPYYPVSQRAYQAARAWVQELREDGGSARLAPELRVKPLFNRLEEFTIGKNTLAYLSGIGSRFHVQILESEENFPLTDELGPPRRIGCGECRACIQACPGGAIREDGFDPHRCIRFWMLNGQLPPPELRFRMGNRLLGCDRCQACCPINQPPITACPSVPLELLFSPQASAQLAPWIGSNYARPGRILIHACILAAALKRSDLLPVLRGLESHPLPAVREAAEEAAYALTMDDSKLEER